MSLAAVVDALADRLADVLGAGTAVGDAAARADGLPAVTLSLDEVEQRLAGVGRTPRGTRRGALVVEAEVDLANPVADLGDGETLQLLSADRRTLVVPHGPLVRADGTEDTPFEPGDVGVDDGAPFALVAEDPVGRQFVVDPVEGTLTFGAGLAAAGTLALALHVGRWDVTVTRAQGLLVVDATASDAAGVRDLARRVAAALDVQAAEVRLWPRSWGAAAPRDLGPGTADAQRLTYRLDAEIEQPVIPTGGGRVRRVEVVVRLPVAGGTAEEAFVVAGEGSPE